MKISAKAEYACLAVLALARKSPDDPPVRIREISAAHGIPERYLVQILLQLKGAGLVVSTRGASGGYRLARPATSITLGEVLTAIDGPEAPVRGPPKPRPRGRGAGSGSSRPRRCSPPSGRTSAPPSARCWTRPRSPSSPNGPRPAS